MVDTLLDSRNVVQVERVGKGEKEERREGEKTFNQYKNNYGVRAETLLLSVPP